MDYAGLPTFCSWVGELIGLSRIKTPDQPRPSVYRGVKRSSVFSRHASFSPLTIFELYGYPQDFAKIGLFILHTHSVDLSLRRKDIEQKSQPQNTTNPMQESHLGALYGLQECEGFLGIIHSLLGFKYMRSKSLEWDEK